MSVADQIEHQAAGFVWRAEVASSPLEDRNRDDWLNQSPRHRAAFLRLSTAWRTTDALRERPGDLSALSHTRDAGLSPLILVFLSTVAAAALQIDPDVAEASAASCVPAVADSDMMTFDDMTVAEIVQIFNSRNSTKLIVTDPTISQQRIGGTFSPGHPERFAAALEQLLYVRVVREGPIIRLEPLVRTAR